MYEEIYLVFIRSLCIFVDILPVIRSLIFFNIKYEYNITLNDIKKHIKCLVMYMARPNPWL